MTQNLIEAQYDVTKKSKLKKHLSKRLTLNVGCSTVKLDLAVY